jgi:hypothetical protein
MLFLSFRASEARQGIQELLIVDSGSSDRVVIGQYTDTIVIPAKAGIQNLMKILDSCFRRNDFDAEWIPAKQIKMRHSHSPERHNG